jgi:phosphate acetyltransferase
MSPGGALDFLERLEARAIAAAGRIVLAEGEDPRVFEAAGELADRGACELTLVCPTTSRTQTHTDLVTRGVQLIDPVSDPHRERLAEFLLKRRAHKGLTIEQARTAVEDPLFFASLLVATGEADGSIGGAVRTTADTVRAALQCIWCTQIRVGVRMVSWCLRTVR